MSGITTVSSTPIKASSAAAPAAAAAAPSGAAAPQTTATPADNSNIGGGQSSTSGIQMYQASEVSKDTSKPLPPQPEPTRDPVILTPYQSTPEKLNASTHVDVQQKPPAQPIKKTHFSIIEGPASPDP